MVLNQTFKSIHVYKYTNIKIGLGDLKNMIKLKIVCAFVTVKMFKIHFKFYHKD